MKRPVYVDNENCNGCMLCLQTCVLGNFKDVGNGKVAPADGLACFSCGHCVAVCPPKAITHSALDIEAFGDLDESKRPSYDQFLEFLKMRRSRREFKDDPIPHDVINQLLNAAVEAPSSCNRQSLLFTVVSNREALQKIAERSWKAMGKISKVVNNPVAKLFLRGGKFKDIMEVLPLMENVATAGKEGRDLILYDAPCAIFIHAPHDDMFAPDDAFFSAQNILLAAETLGLGTCVVGLVTAPINRDPKMKKLAGIPKGHKVLCTIALGYPKFTYKRSIPKHPPKVKFVE